MFEEQLLAGGTERGIALETRMGNPIGNVLEPAVDERGRRTYDLIRKKHGQRWFNRKAACGGYNCYGMAFASRRTSILEDTQIPDILKDDGYREIQEDQVVVGDLVFYRDRKLGLLHVARITRRDEMKALHALSKWNSICGEDEHNIRHDLWSEQGFDVELEFWTDRP